MTQAIPIPETGGPAVSSQATAVAVAAEPSASEIVAGVEEDSAWRDELAVRLSRYRSRRKMPPPRYPSLYLQFDRPGLSTHEERSQRVSVPEDESGAKTDYPFAHGAVARDQKQDICPPNAVESVPPMNVEAPLSVNYGAKIIEFPRFAWAPPPPPPDQLAEPVSDKPRILEVPEVVPPPPALGGITIEPSEVLEVEKRPGVDFPLQSASFTHRVIAAGVDGLIIAIASAFFGVIFWKVAGIHPPGPQMMGLALGIPCLFWAMYEYLLLVYAGGTPGLRVAGLELTRFDGSATTRSLRRWRVLASYLSAASLGMGYVWVLLDEDALCWHDRITHTYLAPRKLVSKA
ncbi:MAG TPA: RDD family protein [Candidatus Sulfotelmatobacter sp.]|nr:RDD family protein [Candidatus Sulfotelmatobacter sp.]